MNLTVLARLFALLLFALAWSTSALARNDTYTYEGNLIPMKGAAPISIVLQMEESGGFLSGNVKVGAPLDGNAPIKDGRNIAGKCNLATVLSKNVTLRLYGDCGATVFEGIFTVYYTQPKAIARGTFRLLRKVQVSNKGKDIDGFELPTLTLSACLKTNTRCLAACPRGDTDIEYLCSNRCRTKLQGCKAQVAKQTATDEPN